MPLADEPITFQPDDTATPPAEAGPAAVADTGEAPDVEASDKTTDQADKFVQAFGMQWTPKPQAPTGLAAYAPLSFMQGVFNQELSWPSGELAAWQAELIKAGLIAPKAKVHPGVPDPVTSAATRRLFAFMKVAGVTDPYKALQLLSQGTEVGGGGGSGGGRRVAPKPGTPEYRDAYMNTAQQIGGWLGGMG